MPSDKEQAASRIQAGMDGRKKRQAVAEKRKIQKMGAEGGGKDRDKIAGAGSLGSCLAGTELTEYEKGTCRNAFDMIAKGKHSCDFREAGWVCRCPVVPKGQYGEGKPEPEIRVDNPGKMTKKSPDPPLLKLMRSLSCRISNGEYEKMKAKEGLEDFGAEETKDVDGDGEIGFWVTFSKFCDIYQKWKPDYRKQQETLTNAFDLWDTNDDGFIDEDEFVYVLTNCGEKLDDHDVRAVVKQFQEADADNDGRINKKEFIKFFMTRHTG